MTLNMLKKILPISMSPVCFHTFHSICAWTSRKCVKTCRRHADRENWREISNSHVIIHEIRDARTWPFRKASTEDFARPSRVATSSTDDCPRHDIMTRTACHVMLWMCDAMMEGKYKCNIARSENLSGVAKASGKPCLFETVGMHHQWMVVVLATKRWRHSRKCEWLRCSLFETVGLKCTNEMVVKLMTAVETYNS